MNGSLPPLSNRYGLHHVEHVMGMAISIDIRDRTAPPEAVDEVVAWLHHVDATFSTHKPDSPISAMGRGELSFADASDEIRDVLRLCESMRLETDGAFDVFEVPAPNGTRLDPSGLVKGWSIERAATMLESAGCANFCLNAGGDIAVRGRPAGDARWRVGIRHTGQVDALALVIEVDGPLAIATSANYERSRHIVTPWTGEAADDLTGATVVGPDLTVADAFATALFVKGVDGLGWLETRADYDGYVITNEGRTQWTSGFNRYRSE